MTNYTLHFLIADGNREVLRIAICLEHKICFLSRHWTKSSWKRTESNMCGTKLLKICSSLNPVDCFDLLMSETQPNDRISDFLPHKKHFSFIKKINQLLHCSVWVCIRRNQRTFLSQTAERFNFKACSSLSWEFFFLSHCLMLILFRLKLAKS